jgi:hypothetical protein
MLYSVLLTESVWGQLRNAIIKGEPFLVPLQNGTNFRLQWEEHVRHYVNPFDGYPYQLDWDSIAVSTHMSHSQALALTSCLSVSKVVYIDNPDIVDVGLSGKAGSEYIWAMQRKLESLIPSIETAHERTLILQVDLQPRTRHWFEIRVIPDSGDFDLEMLNDSLDDIPSPVVNVRLRFHIFFRIRGSEG